MISKYLTLNIEEEEIACAVISHEETDILPKCVYLHGAGTGVKEGAQAIAKPLIEQGINILTFDFSGHGESSGELKKGSLKKRVKEAESVINAFASQEPLTLLGASMGGFIAIKMLELFKVDTLILFCPALYDSRAYDVCFDEGFTDIIRQTESWKQTDVLDALNNFAGKLLVVMGKKDDVIPEGVIALIKKNTTHAIKKEFYTIPGCPHKISKWILEHEDEKYRLHQKISEFCK